MTQNKAVFGDRSGSPKLGGKQHGLAQPIFPSPTTDTSKTGVYMMPQAFLKTFFLKDPQAKSKYSSL